MQPPPPCPNTQLLPLHRTLADYVLITPVRNEAGHLLHTIAPMGTQLLRPPLDG